MSKYDLLKTDSQLALSLKESFNSLDLADNLFELSLSQEDIFSSIKEGTVSAVKLLGHGASITTHSITSFIIAMEKVLSNLTSARNKVLISLSGNLTLIDKEIDRNLSKLSITAQEKSDSILVVNSLYEALLYDGIPNQYNAGIKEFERIISSSKKEGFLEWLAKNRLEKIIEEVETSLKQSNSVVTAFNQLKSRKLLTVEQQINDYVNYSIYNLHVEKFYVNQELKLALRGKKKLLGNHQIHIEVDTYKDVIKNIHTHFYFLKEGLNKPSLTNHLKALSAAELKVLYHDIKSLITLSRHYEVEFKDFDALMNHSIKLAVKGIEDMNKITIVKSDEAACIMHFFTLFFDYVLEYLEPQLKLYEHLNKSIIALYTFANKNFHNLK